MTTSPLWFVDAPAPSPEESVSNRRWHRQQITGAGSSSQSWVVDQRFFDVPREAVEHALGMVPTHVLDRLEDAGVPLPGSLLELGPLRDRPASDVTAQASVCLVTIDGSPTLGVWWRLDGYTLFAAWWDGWLVSGLRPTDDDFAIRLEEMLG